MAIYRGSGGSGTASDTAAVEQVSSLTSEAETYKDAAAASATSAASSASTATTKASEASTSATSASNNATAAATSATNAATSEANAQTSSNSAALSFVNANQAKVDAQSAQTAAETAETNAETAETNASSSATAAASSATSAATSASTATTKASEAATSATNAASSASAASDSATTAASEASDAATSATAAASSATSASGSAATATTKASEASTSATSASSSASTATTKASEAATSATSASGSASTATTKASEAATSATNAATSASTATTKASEAATSATNASSSATTAASEASDAADSATAAASSATSAASSATTATTKASEASTSASNAATSATNASTSATNAATSETNAATSASTATTKASEASTSATNAATSESNAASSETAAASSATAAGAAKDAALAALDSFDDRYLGVKTSDPTVDNDGDALVTGALYYNSNDDVMKVYDGSSWLAAYADISGALLVTNNLSDLNNASSARTNLGVAIGTDVQAYSSVLAGTTASYTTAEETKLAGIETGADVTDTANVTAAGALMDSEVTNLAQVKAFDSSDYATAAQGALADSALQGNQTITLSGDVSGSGTTSISVTVADDSHNHIISNVDGLQTALDGKVDDSQVLTNVPSGAVFTDTVYTHPSYAGDDFSVDTGALTGATVVSDIDINVTTDSLGHVTDANGSVSTRTLTLADLGYTGETNATADQSASEILTAIKTVDGSGSGLDADNLDGRTWSTTRNSANTLVTRDGAGYTQLGWINTTSGSTTNTITKIYGTYSGDSYIRYFTPATLISQQGIWTSSNDGSGSGLDADTLDGSHASAFAASSHTHTGLLTNGVTYSTAKPTYTTNPSSVGHLWIETDTGYMYVCTDNTTNDNYWKNVGAESEDIQNIAAYYTATYTSGSGTINIPSNAGNVRVTLWGGGGGGGQCHDLNCPYGNVCGCDGADGGSAQRTISGIAGTSVAYSVGAGGAGTSAWYTAGGAGGTTSFGAYASATGGGGGPSCPAHNASCTSTPSNGSGGAYDIANDGSAGQGGTKGCACGTPNGTAGTAGKFIIEWGVGV